MVKAIIKTLVNYGLDAIMLGTGVVAIVLGSKWLKNNVEQDFGE